MEQMKAPNWMNVALLETFIGAQGASFSSIQNPCGGNINEIVGYISQIFN